MSTWRTGTLASIALALSVSPALAHVGLESSSHFASGFMHPLGGLDHVLAMVIVGIYAARLGVSNIWRLPLAFIAAMILGGTLGFGGFALPYVEQGIGLSVIVMGGLVAAGIDIRSQVAVPLVAVFAVLHGHAHGHEVLGLDLSFAPYAAGFVAATALLHVMGIAAGTWLARRRASSSLI